MVGEFTVTVGKATTVTVVLAVLEQAPNEYVNV
jgi:hypothetical protein